MKKMLIIFACLGTLFWTCVVFRLTHILDYYSIPTTSNLPAFHPGDRVFASRLKTPDYNNFICFKLPDKKSTWTFRCIGKPGDIIEIKEAEVYRNGKLLDDSYTDNDYTISHNQINRIEGYLKRNKTELEPLTDTLFRVTLSNKELKQYHLTLKKIISPKGQPNEDLFIDFKNKGYNEDNIGPVKVPADSYFALGDNRHGAFDSRYIGFIKKSEIVSTVLNH